MDYDKCICMNCDDNVYENWLWCEKHVIWAVSIGLISSQKINQSLLPESIRKKHESALRRPG